MIAAEDFSDTRCNTGDGEVASARCAVCTRAYCPACLAPGAAAATCRDCAYDAALGGATKRQVAKSSAAPSQPFVKVKRLRPVASWLVFLASAGVLLGTGVPGTVNALKAPEPFAYGDANPDAPGMAKALGGLWKVRAAMDAYLGAHAGSPPAALSELTGAPGACPGCDGTWQYVRGPGKAWTVACPSPARHERGALLLDQDIGPPQVRYTPLGDAR